ncbi:MAG: DUF2252 family protein [Myxococcota bacterium]|nr:DUF2252 family protein [Myxococcota bacterium]
MRIVAFVPLALLACSPGGPTARAAFIQEVLVEDNRVWLTRDPDLVARKFNAMADDPYDFMRGTVALHFADLARPRAARTPTRFLGTPSSTSVLLVGDPHPENATLCHPETGQPGAPSLEFVDLDAAGFGPWTVDVRRAALGLRILAGGLPGCDADCQEDGVVAMATAYSRRIMDTEPSSPEAGRIIGDLVERAAERGPENRRLRKLTSEAREGRRRFMHTDDTRLEPLSRQERAVVDEAMHAWRNRGDAPQDMRVLDRARRFGSGISSQPALRFAVAWDRGDPSDEDDRLLQLREVIDPPPPPGRALQQTSLFDDNAQRVEYAATLLWSRADADPRASGLRAGGYDLKTMSWTDWLQPIDHERVLEAWVEGRYTPADIEMLGATLGDVLAGSHGRGETASGRGSRAVIRADLESGGGPAALRGELRTVSRLDTRQLERDHRIFIDLLDSQGPLLGAEHILEGVR